MTILTKKYVAPFLTFFITLGVYIITLAPDLTFTDAGELAGAAATLGIAHPTGYPLFILLGHLWTMLPLPGAIIFRMNLFAAVCTAASAGIFVVLSQNFLKILNPSRAASPLPAFASALLYGFAATIWQQSCSVEVYSLQLLLLTIILHLFFKAIDEREGLNIYSYAWSFVLGLGFTNHGSTILLAPACIFLFLWRPSGGKPNFKRSALMIAMLAAPFLIGLSAWLYLPLRASADPIFNWGGVQRSFDKFWYHASGKQFQGWMFQSSAIPGNLKHFISLFPSELGWLGIIPFLYGTAIARKASMRVFWGAVLLIAGCLIYSLTYSIHDIDAYFSLAIIGALLFVAAGLNALTLRKIRFINLAIFTPAALAFALNFNGANQRSNYLVPEYTRILAENLEPNAVILSHLWDFWCSAFWYKQQVEGYRPDIVLIETELLRRTWYPDKVEALHPNPLRKNIPQKQAYLSELVKFEAKEPYSDAIIQQRYEQLLNSYIDSNYANRPVYVTGDVIYNEPAVAAKYIKIPQGFALRLIKPGDAAPNPLPNAEKIDISRFAASLPGASGYLETKIRDLAAMSLQSIGVANEKAGNLEAANDAYQKAAKIREGIPKIKRGQR